MASITSASRDDLSARVAIFLVDAMFNLEVHSGAQAAAGCYTSVGANWHIISAWYLEEVQSKRG
jgi:hypothetical protein